MSIVVVDELQSVHIYEAEHYLHLLLNALLEHIVSDVDEAVSVIDIAERINNVEFI